MVLSSGKVSSATGSTATGEPARSKVWSPSPWKVWLLRGAIWVVPLFGGYLSGLMFTWFVPRPEVVAFAVAWWLAIVLVSTVTVYLVRPLIQGATPLVFLYQCTLVFPDRAPSRYKVALKQRTARDLKRKVDAGEPIADTPQAAAEEIVSILGYLNDHDRRTRGHSERVRAYSDLIATELGIDESDRAKLHWAALLHDVGKMSVSPAILNKQGSPTDEEWQELRRHPGAASGYLQPLRPWLGSWLDAATQHHEHWNGAGYPRGLAGNEISVAGRIVAVADAYDVMTSIRSYKTASTPDEARAELARCAGTQFDPRVVRAFLSVSTRNLTDVAGPLSWLTHWPRLAEVASALGSAGSTAAGSLATAAAVATLAVTPAIAATYDGPAALGAAPQVAAVAPEVTPTAPSAGTSSGPEPTTEQTATTLGAVPAQVPTVETTTAAPPDSEPTTIPSPSGQVIQIGADEVPGSLDDGRLQSDVGVFLIAEGQPRVASSTIEVVAPGPGAVTLGSAQRRTIAANTQICTYLLHADSPSQNIDLNFTIELTETIIGFAVSDSQLAASANWQIPGVDYAYAGIEAGDFVVVDGRTLTGKLSGSAGRDQVRVFTSC